MLDLKISAYFILAAPMVIFSSTALTIFFVIGHAVFSMVIPKTIRALKW